MTQIASNIVEQDKLWLTDAELIRRLGVPRDRARAVLRDLDRPGSGFPKKVKLWGDRRYWPAVKAYFDEIYTPKIIASQRGTRR